MAPISTAIGGLIAAAVAPTLNAHFGDKQGLEDQHVNGGMGLFVAHAAKTIPFPRTHQFDPEETETFVTYATDGQSNAAFSNDNRINAGFPPMRLPYVAHTLRAKYDAGEDGTERRDAAGADQFPDTRVQY